MPESTGECLSGQNELRNHPVTNTNKVYIANTFMPLASMLSEEYIGVLLHT